MDIPVLLAIASLILVVLIGLTFILKSSKAKKAPEDKPRQVPSKLKDGAPRRAQLAKNRARLRAHVEIQKDKDSDIEDEEKIEKEEIELPEGKIGAKKRAKLEAKAEKKAAREAEEQLRNERKKKAELEEDERKRQQEEEEAAEKQREEEKRKAKEEKERQEYEEYLKMKEAFSVEEEGFEEGEEGEAQNMLQEFVNFIKMNKVLVIEDLAAHFKLKTQACIDRIKDLQKDEILTGIIDDRGKFIYVSQSEMEAVAKFIRQRGRVSIAEIAENSNQLINLVPTKSPNAT